MWPGLSFLFFFFFLLVCLFEDYPRMKLMLWNVSSIESYPKSYSLIADRSKL